MSRPNILVIMTDDHAQWALRCYGNQLVESPNLDYLAGIGARFNNAFTPTPVCSPARATFFTGRLPSQHGIHDWLKEQLPEVSERDWMRGEITLPQLLEPQGYETALVGKWHCGHGDVPQPGFTHWWSLGQAQGVHQGRHTFYCGDTPTDLVGFKSGVVSDHALDFLRRRDAHRPFFLFLGLIATHSPWSGHPERLVDRYRGRVDNRHLIPSAGYEMGRTAGEGRKLRTLAEKREALAQYYAAVTEIDEQAGRVFDELQSQGLWDDTVIVYTADHGLCFGHHGIWGKGNGSRPLNMLEESIRIPLLMRVPGSHEGVVRDELVDHTDVFMTLLQLAGCSPDGEARAARGYHGRSLAPVFCGGTVDRKEALFGEYGPVRMVRTTSHKLVRRYPSGPDELYDLERDPGELENRITDSSYAAVRQALDQTLERHFAEVDGGVRSGLAQPLPVHNGVEAWCDW